MPELTDRPCTYPGCPTLTKGNRCDKHRALLRQQDDRRRPNATRRGYDSEWRKRRARILRKEPLCRECRKNGVKPIPIANEVDHIIPRDAGGSEDDSNLQPLCKSCHSAKTIKEDGGFGNEKANRFGDKTAIELMIRPPNLKPSAIPLTIMCGPAGAGKSTYVAQHASPNDMIIDMDAIRAELGIGHEQWDASTLIRSLTRRNQMLADLATVDAPHAWFIVSAASSQERAWWRNALRPNAIIVVMASAKTCQERIKATRQGSGQERAIKAASKWWANYSHNEMDTEIRAECCKNASVGIPSAHDSSQKERQDARADGIDRGFQPFRF